MSAVSNPSSPRAGQKTVAPSRCWCVVGLVRILQPMWACRSQCLLASRRGRRVRNRSLYVGCRPDSASATARKYHYHNSYANAFSRQSQQALLLGVLQCQALKASEDDRIYASSFCQTSRPVRTPSHVRYATTIESLRSMASSATAFVRSTVSSTEFICRRTGSNGASSSTSLHQLELLPDCHARCSYSQYYRSSYPPAPLDIFTPHQPNASNILFTQ